VRRKGERHRRPLKRGRRDDDFVQVTPATAAAPAAPDAAAPAPPPLDDLRRQRADLTAEAVRVGRWSRLLRARCELLLAASTPLGGLAGGPAAADLRDLAAAAADDPSLLLRLQVACHDLDGYAATVARRRRELTDAVVEGYAADPRAALALLAELGSARAAADPLGVQEHDRPGLQA
jgi:hypothetical protein